MTEFSERPQQDNTGDGRSEDRSYEPEIARLPDWEVRELLRRTLWERDEARAEVEQLRTQKALAWDEGFQARTLMAYELAGPQRNPYLWVGGGGAGPGVHPSGATGSNGRP